MKGKTESPLTLSQRREQAYRLISRGFTNADIARNLKVTPETVYTYRKQFEKKIQEQKQQNPGFLQDILQNTFQMLEELDQVRTELWKQYEETDSVQIKNQLMTNIMKAQTERAKLMGLFGVKHEYFVQVNNIKLVQEKLLDFMKRELCEDDRYKLEKLLTNELAPYVGQPQLPQVLSSSQMDE